MSQGSPGSSNPPGRPKAPPVKAVPAVGDLERTDTNLRRPAPALGPVETFLQDPAVTEIMVNDLRNVMIEKDGKMSFSGFRFQTLDELERFTRGLLAQAGASLSPEQPFVDLMLPDGSRVNIVGAPLTLNGPCITIRKFPSKRLTVEQLVAHESLDRRMAHFLHACVAGRMNLLICGGTGSGKTTLLNVLAGFVPAHERLVTIEDTPELMITHTNSVRMQTRPATPASPAITSRDLVANALRMRPDRIIVGECRRNEALDMLQAMNTGHAGSMTTIHANSPRDGLARLETLCLMSGVELPLLAIRKQIASAVDLIIQIKRFRNGKRKLIALSEITGMEGETITMQDIFVYEMPQAQGAKGGFRCTGFVPTFIERLRENGVELPRDFFA